MSHIQSFIQDISKVGIRIFQGENYKYNPQTEAILRLNQICHNRHVPYNLKMCSTGQFQANTDTHSANYVDITPTNTLVQLADITQVYFGMRIDTKNEMQQKNIIQQIKQIIKLLFIDFQKMYPENPNVDDFVKELLERFIQTNPGQEDRVEKIRDAALEEITDYLNDIEPFTPVPNETGPKFRVQTQLTDIVRDSVVLQTYELTTDYITHINTLAKEDIQRFTLHFSQLITHSNYVYESLLITKLMLEDTQRYKVLYIIQNPGLFNKLDIKQRNQIITLAIYILEQKYDHFCMLILTVYLKIKQNEKLITFFINRLLFQETQLCWYLVNMFMYDWDIYTSLYETIGTAILNNADKTFSKSFYQIIRHLSVEKLKKLAKTKTVDQGSDRLKRLVKALRWF